MTPHHSALMDRGRIGASDAAGWYGALWLGMIALLASFSGLALPWAIDSALEVYALLFAVIVVAGFLAMPRRLSFNDTACWAFFLAFVVLFSLYPGYISFRILGGPWINPIRLVLAIVLVMWLYALRASHDMQSDIGRYIRENQPFFIFFGIWIASQALSIVTSPWPSQSLQKFLLFQLYWTFPFFAALSLVRTERRLTVLIGLFVAFAAYQCVIGLVEARLERLIWLNFLPAGFGGGNEVYERILQGQFRGGSYRVQGSFSMSLIYAEFLSLMLPFALYALVQGRRVVIRITGLLVAIAILPVQHMSGSRLGMVGTIVVFLGFMVIYVVRSSRIDRRSLTGPFLLLMLPFALAAFGAAYTASPRLQTLTIGGGLHQASTDGRMAQARQAAEKFVRRPLFGHGIGVGGEALDFRNPAGVLSIDSYYLSLLLEVGIVGTVAYFGMFLWAIWVGITCYLKPRDGPNRYGGPIALSLIAFLVIKMVLSQQDTHMLMFLMLALVLVVRRMTAVEAVAAPPHEMAAARSGNGRGRPAPVVIEPRKTSRPVPSRAARGALSLATRRR